MNSLYASIGGPAAVATVVDGLYARLLSDPVVAPYFERIDLQRLKSHQRGFLAAALGGPDVYRGRNLAAAHAGLGITEAAFDRVTTHLVDALRHAEVTQEAIDEILIIVAPLRQTVCAVPA